MKVTVTEGGRKRTLTEGTDYSVTYQQNTDAGQGTAIVRGNGLYKGTLRTAFQITPKPMKKLKVVTGSMTIGSQTEPPVYVYDGTKRLENGKDYKLAYAKDLTARASKAAKVTVTAMANYEGSSTVKLAVYEGDASASSTQSMLPCKHSLCPIPERHKACTDSNYKWYRTQGE